MEHPERHRMTRQLSVHDIGLQFGGETDAGATIGRFLDTLDWPPALLGLGEPTHGVEAFPLLRNELLKYLVEHHGYRSIALEIDCVAAAVLDDYVRTGRGELADVVAAGFNHGFDAWPSNHELIAWLRDYNTGRDPRYQVRCYGFDAPTEITAAPSPRATLLGAHAYLREHVPAERLPHDAETLDTLLGDDADWTNPDAMMDAGRSIGQTDRARTLRLAADDLLAVYTTEAPGLRQASSDNDFERAYLLARMAHGLLRYHAAMATPGPDRAAVLLGLRDGMMADNLLDIVRIEKHRGPCLVFAHNSHLQRTESSWQGHWEGADFSWRWWSAGAIAAATLNTEYVFIAADYGHCANAPLPQDDPRSLHAVLAAATTDRALFPARLLTAALDSDVTTRVSTDHRYGPLSPAALDGADAVVFIAQVSR
ncbi:erythromycin esterase family protein [Nocardia suismassiliense]|uniref:erythromycin esterase family protein n=1 Tax=Nocardia suismassiliense TaxID=2077092 RepID=UPI001F213488|nr:erythromycin esterase family protein [Nocardia suismassiliense]